MWLVSLQVPTFIHNNHAVNESLAICDYLEVNFCVQLHFMLFPYFSHL